MPRRDDAVRYVENPATTTAELRRACALLAVPDTGESDELRERLRVYLAAHDAGRPVVCLNPGPVRTTAHRVGPRIPRPGNDEFAAAFADEIALVPDTDDIAALLDAQIDTTRALAATFGESHADIRCACDKWTVRETIGHLSDCERVLSYRLLRALRSDVVALAGFDHVAYVGSGGFEARSLASVVDEFVAVRGATVSLLASAAPGQFESRLPVGSGSITGRALAYVIAGHERHHQHLLRTRYLPHLPVA